MRTTGVALFILPVILGDGDSDADDRGRPLVRRLVAAVHSLGRAARGRPARPGAGLRVRLAGVAGLIRFLQPADDAP